MENLEMYDYFSFLFYHSHKKIYLYEKMRSKPNVKFRREMKRVNFTEFIG